MTKDRGHDDRGGDAWLLPATRWSYWIDSHCAWHGRRSVERVPDKRKRATRRRHSPGGILTAHDDVVNWTPRKRALEPLAGHWSCSCGPSPLSQKSSVQPHLLGERLFVAQGSLERLESDDASHIRGEL